MIVGLVGGGYGLLVLFNSLGFAGLWWCLIRWALPISGGFALVWGFGLLCITAGFSGLTFNSIYNSKQLKIYLYSTIILI